MLLLIIVMVTPVILIGLISPVYFRDVIRSDIGNENLDQAKIISSFTANYVNSSRLYLESQASRPSVFEAVNRSNIAFLTDTIMHIQNASIFSGVYVTNCSGIVISSYPANITMINISDRPGHKTPLTGRRASSSRSPSTLPTRPSHGR